MVLGKGSFYSGMTCRPRLVVSLAFVYSLLFPATLMMAVRYSLAEGAVALPILPIFMICVLVDSFHVKFVDLSIFPPWLWFVKNSGFL